MSRTLVVAPTEVGVGVVPSHPPEGVFRHVLGTLNASVVVECDHVWRCTSGLARGATCGSLNA